MPVNATPETAVDRSSGAHVIGGEMVGWSDLGVAAPSAAVAEVLRAIIAERAPRRVLLAGAAAAAHLPLVPTETEVEVLVRAMPDTGAVADLGALHENLRTSCGTLDRYAPAAPLDLVVALGGATTLLGPDGTGMSEAAVLERLASYLAPEGTAMLLVTNGLGLHEFFAATPSVDPNSNDNWWVGAPGYDRRPLYRREADSALTAAGLSTAVTYAAYSAPSSPTLLFTEAASAQERTAALLKTMAAADLGHSFGDRPALRDPETVVDMALSSGNGHELAPAWLVVASREQATSIDLAGYPVVVSAESTAAPRWARLRTLDATGASTSRWASGRTETEQHEGPVSRDLSLATDVAGPTLESLMRAACADRDHKSLRGYVTEYAAWLADNSVWSKDREQHRFLATPDNVARTDEGLAVIDGSWAFADARNAADALVRGLRTFSTRLLASAAEHPWRSDSTPDSVTTSLMAMTGATLTRAEIERAVQLQTAFQAVAADRGQDPVVLAERELERGLTPRDLPAANAVGFRELLQRDRVLSRRDRDHGGQVGWLEGTLRMRDRYIRELERTITGFEETMTYRTVQAIRAPRRMATQKAVSTAKATANEVLPPDFMSKARRMAKKMAK